MAYNFLGGSGYLTDEQRKQSLTHGNCLTFKTSIDASHTIEVSSGIRKEISAEEYSEEVADFICWWTRNVLKDLNGFSGFGKFKIMDFKIVN